MKETRWRIISVLFYTILVIQNVQSQSAILPGLQKRQPGEEFRIQRRDAGEKFRIQKRDVVEELMVPKKDAVNEFRIEKRHLNEEFRRQKRDAGEPLSVHKRDAGEEFTCAGKVIGGYYADIQQNCQTFHVCTIGLKGVIRDIVFRCLNGTVFEQETRVCERTEEVDCSNTESFYHLNNDLYGPGVIPATSKKYWEKLTLTHRHNSDRHPTDSICRGSESAVFFSDLESDCKNYHLCIPQDSLSALAVKFRCADEGFIFNYEIGQCDLASKSKCFGASSSQIAPSERKFYRVTPYEAESLAVIATALCSLGSKDWKILDPISDCRQYIQCEATSLYSPVPILIKTCPVGTLFSQEYQKCVSAKNFSCELSVFALVRNVRVITRPYFIDNEESEFRKSGHEDLKSRIHRDLESRVYTNLRNRGYRGFKNYDRPKHLISFRKRSSRRLPYFYRSKRGLGLDIRDGNLSQNPSSAITKSPFLNGRVSIVESQSLGNVFSGGQTSSNVDPNLWRPTGAVAQKSSDFDSNSGQLGTSPTFRESRTEVRRITHKKALNDPVIPGVSGREFGKTPMPINGTIIEVSEIIAPDLRGKVTITSVVPKITSQNGNGEQSLRPQSNIPKAAPTLISNQGTKITLVGSDSNLSLESTPEGHEKSSISQLGNSTITEPYEDGGQTTLPSDTDISSPSETTTAIIPDREDSQQETTPSPTTFSSATSSPIPTTKDAPPKVETGSPSKVKTNFTCKDKELEQFYPDLEQDCKLFHYCSPGFSQSEVLDLTFVCSGETKFDINTKKCQDESTVVCGSETTADLSTKAAPATTQTTTTTIKTTISTTTPSTTSTTESTTTSTTQSTTESTTSVVTSKSSTPKSTTSTTTLEPTSSTSSLTLSPSTETTSTASTGSIASIESSTINISSSSSTVSTLSSTAIPANPDNSSNISSITEVLSNAKVEVTKQNNTKAGQENLLLNNTKLNSTTIAEDENVKDKLENNRNSTVEVTMGEMLTKISEPIPTVSGAMEAKSFSDSVQPKMFDEIVKKSSKILHPKMFTESSQNFGPKALMETSENIEPKALMETSENIEPKALMETSENIESNVEVTVKSLEPTVFTESNTQNVEVNTENIENLELQSEIVDLKSIPDTFEEFEIMAQKLTQNLEDKPSQSGFNTKNSKKLPSLPVTEDSQTGNASHLPVLPSEFYLNSTSMSVNLTELEISNHTNITIDPQINGTDLEVFNYPNITLNPQFNVTDLEFSDHPNITFNTQSNGTDLNFSDNSKINFDPQVNITDLGFSNYSHITESQINNTDLGFSNHSDIFFDSQINGNDLQYIPNIFTEANTSLTDTNDTSLGKNLNYTDINIINDNFTDDNNNTFTDDSNNTAILYSLTTLKSNVPILNIGANNTVSFTIDNKAPSTVYSAFNSTVFSPVDSPENQTVNIVTENVSINGNETLAFK